MKYYFIVLIFGLISCTNSKITNTSRSALIVDDTILAYEVDLKYQNLNFYYLDDNSNRFGSIKKLKDDLNSKDTKLIFATNGGMYNKDYEPQGLYIENFKQVKQIDTIMKGYGNFYLQPNGIFFINKDNQASIIESNKFIANQNIKFATQSGPMLLIDGENNIKFNKESTNLNIRNGVGLLENGNLLFAMSKDEVNFYNFSEFFRVNKCKYALYLDGFVSRSYFPDGNWIQEDGDFGVIIGVTETNN